MSFEHAFLCQLRARRAFGPPGTRDIRRRMRKISGIRRRAAVFRRQAARCRTANSLLYPASAAAGRDGPVAASMEAAMSPVAWKAIGPLAGAISLLAIASLGSEARQAPPAAPAVYAGGGQVSEFVGSDLYHDYCAVCHGTSAKGDGPLADKMKKRPPDLTQFTRQNGGVFPAEMVKQIIDGRQPIPNHGGPDMPVWGDAFKTSRAGGSEAAVNARIDELVKYLESLQTRTAN
jgi:cytochrome c5